MSMMNLYKLYALGALRVNDGTAIKKLTVLQYHKLESGLYFSQEYYKRYVGGIMTTNIERTKLTKQLVTGDRNFIHTLLNLLDYYSGEDIYGQLYTLMRNPKLNDQELDAMIAECPEKYRRSMTKEEAKAAVWNVIRHLNGDESIQ